MKKCVFAGTFDPPTVGHEDIVKKCLNLFDEVVVALLVNPEKKQLFSEEDRLRLLRAAFGGYARVRVVRYSGMLVDLMRQEGSRIYVRGLRNPSDYEYESAMDYVNTELYPDLITVYLPTRREHLAVSSGNVRQLLSFGRDVSGYLPLPIREQVVQLYEAKKHV